MSRKTKETLARHVRVITLSILAAVAAGMAAVSTGCAHSPENQEWVAWDDLSFQGYAENPGATIQIQAYDQSTGTWDVVATATSSSSPTTFGGDQLYAWSRTHFDFTGVPDWTCYWGYGGYCSIPAGYASARFRFKEVGSSLDFMVTFDNGGTDCVIDKVLHEGETWIAAGYACMGEESPVLTLRVLT